MNYYRTIAGESEILLTCADPASALQTIVSCGISVSDVQQLGDLTVGFRIHRRFCRILFSLGQRKGWQVTLRRSTGWRRMLRTMFGRPVLMIFILVLLFATGYLPGKVLFVRVEGNFSVPAREILSNAESCGIGFGASRRLVRSQKVKDALLESMPQLQWAGVTTSGCVATITVRERAEEAKTEEGGISSIVADRDGVIMQITAIHGTAKKVVGQAVQAGEVLISGYTDCGFCIRAQRAQGEVFARTERELLVVAPSDWVQEDLNQPMEKKYAIIIGKKRINFYKGSGISGTTCDKMYSENYLTLPGGFQLPVCIVTETWTNERTPRTLEYTQEALLTDFASAYLTQQMTAGTVIQGWEEINVGEGICCLTGKYACIEMIGRQRNEEIIKPNE